MTTHLPGEVAEYLVKQSQPTHRMTPQDLSVWAEFNNLLTGNYAFVRYDVRLGPGRPAPLGTGEQEQAMWTALTQYRCDVGIATESLLYLLEIKPVVTHAMLGQLIAYNDARGDTPFEQHGVVLVGLARTGNAHVQLLARSLGLLIVTLDDPVGVRAVFGNLVQPLVP